MRAVIFALKFFCTAGLVLMIIALGSLNIPAFLAATVAENAMLGLYFKAVQR